MFLTFLKLWLFWASCLSCSLIAKNLKPFDLNITSLDTFQVCYHASLTLVRKECFGGKITGAQYLAEIKPDHIFQGLEPRTSGDFMTS